MDKDCIFCQIAHGDKEKLVWENVHAAAFPDIAPKAPVHLLVVPKRHIERLTDLEDKDLAGELMMAVRAAAASQDLIDYQVRIHNGRGAGQEVDHLHLHILGKN